MSQDSPRWTLPPRREISPENLHISSFVIAKKRVADDDTDYSLLLLTAGDKHRLSFRRGKLLLPAAVLGYGENPREGARRALREQLLDPTPLKEPVFLSVQSYLGAHWDIVFLFETWLEPGDQDIIPKDPFVKADLYRVSRLPRSQIAEDHLEVIDGMLHPSEENR